MNTSEVTNYSNIISFNSKTVYFKTCRYNHTFVEAMLGELPLF